MKTAIAPLLLFWFSSLLFAMSPQETEEKYKDCHVTITQEMVNGGILVTKSYHKTTVFVEQWNDDWGEYVIAKRTIDRLPVARIIGIIEPKGLIMSTHSLLAIIEYENGIARVVWKTKNKKHRLFIPYPEV